MELLLAPMATLTHRALRELIKSFPGCNTYYTEMINAGSLLNGGPYEKYYIDNEPDPLNTIYQIVGGDIDKITSAARLLLQNHCKGLDINMGCCAPDITKAGAGVMWMSRFNELPILLKELKNIINDAEEYSGEHKTLCIKCRISPCDKFCNFNENDFWHFIDLAASGGVDQITIHARCRREKYKDHPHYQFIEEVARRYKNNFKVVANGDIKDAETLATIKNICPSVNSFMIARAAIQKPWIFFNLSHSADSQNYLLKNPIKDPIKLNDADNFIPTQNTLFKTAHTFIDLVEKYLPSDFYKTRLQRFFTYYADNFMFSHYFRTQLLNSCNTTPDCVIENCKKTLDSLVKVC